MPFIRNRYKATRLLFVVDARMSISPLIRLFKAIRTRLHSAFLMHESAQLRQNLENYPQASVRAADPSDCLPHSPTFSETRKSGPSAPLCPRPEIGGVGSNVRHGVSDGRF